MAYTQNADEVIVRHAVWFDTMKHPKMPTQCHAVTLAWISMSVEMAL